MGNLFGIIILLHQSPEIIIKAKAHKDFADFPGIRTLPVFFQAAGIPFLREFPAGLHRHLVAGVIVMAGQPAVKMVLRTEGEDGRSGETDVVPETLGGDDEVDQPVRFDRLAGT